MGNVHKTIDVFPMVVHPPCSSTAVRLVTGVAESATPVITPVPSVNSVDSVALCRTCGNFISDHKSRHNCVSRSSVSQTSELVSVVKSDTVVTETLPSNKSTVEYSSCGQLGRDSVHNGSTDCFKSVAGRASHTSSNSTEYNNLDGCPCKSQCKYDSTNGMNFGDYGFIPLQPIGKIIDKGFNIGLKMGYVDLHKLLIHKGIPNCIDSQILIPTDLNIPLWEKLLHGNRDHQLIYFLKYGFPLDVPQSPKFEPNTVVTNHSTALQHPECISKYLEVEILNKAIMGPFKKPPLDGLHCSPMLTRPKAGSTNRRVIVDLSWPHGKSINDRVCNDKYMGSVFKLKFPTVDDITERVQKLGGNCLLYKIDLQRAFRHLKLDPKDINYTGLMYLENYYVDTAVPFGYRHGSVCMQRVTDSIRIIMHKKGFFITNYIDDLIGCDEPQVAIVAFQFLKKLIVDLGLVISESKLFQPQKCIPCLGINVDIETGIISIPDDKLNEIISLCKAWSSKIKSHKKGLQSLVGSLLYIHKCVKPARLFVNRILATLREAPDNGPINLTREFQRDMAWFNAFLPHFNGKVYFDKLTKPPITNLYVDACLTGMGGSWGSRVYALPVQTISYLPINCSIVHLEMVNVFIALNLWKSDLKGRNVIIYCDNMAVVSTLTSGRSWDEFLGTIARNVWLITASYDIELSILHVPGKDNGRADSLSRWFGGGLSSGVVNDLLSLQWCNVSNEILRLNETI